ncbi:MAG: glycine oxidase ThiO [Pseudomonadota bacterium]
MEQVIVIGAGIIGMLTAHLLSKQGLKVKLIEQGYAGKESTWAGGGIISPLYPWRYNHAVTQLALWSQKNYKKLLEQVELESGIDPQYYQSGLLYLNIETEEKQALEWAKKYQYTIETIDDQQLKTLSPQLSSDFTQGWYSQETAQLRNPRLVKSLRELMQKNPLIDLLQQTKVDSLLQQQQQQHQVTGVNTDAGKFYADRVIVAGGAWSAQLLDGLIDVPKIAPVKGQMIVFKADKQLVKQIILSHGRYIIPRIDGRVLLGSTLEFEGFDKSTPSGTLNELKQQAYRIVPALRDYQVEKHWAGLRPGAIDGLPYIGEHPQLKNLYVNAGHFRNGVVLGYASCELLKNILLDETPIVDPSPYGLTAKRMSSTASAIDLKGAI